MPVFRYQGLTERGENVSGLIDAKQQITALQQLKDRQIDVINLKQIESKSNRLKKSKPKSSDYYALLEQLSVLVDADIPVLEAIESLKRSVEYEQLADELDAVLRQLRRGERLAPSLRECMPRLPKLVTSLVELGEQTGQLAEVMKTIGDQLSKQEKIKKDLQGAFTYPAFLMGVGVFAVIFLFVFVVPRFSAMVGDDLSELPVLARGVFSVSAFLTEQWLASLALLALFVGGIIAVVTSEGARKQLLDWAFPLPIIGELLRLSELANWTRTVGMAFSARANLTDAVTLARSTINSRSNRAAFDNVARDLRAGIPLDAALEKVPDIEPVVINLVNTGIRAGRLADLLMMATRVLDERIEDLSDRVSKLAEPVAVLMISSLVGLVVISLVSAMTSLYDFAI